MPNLILDATDARILKELQENARLTNVDLAARVHLSPSPCLARVRELERRGLISRYVTLLNAEMLGLGVSVFITVRLERQIEKMLGIFQDAMERYPEVMECYLMSGGADYMIRVVVSDIPALERFIVQNLSKIPGVANIESSFALKQIKYKTALPLPNLQRESSAKVKPRRRKL